MYPAKSTLVFLFRAKSTLDFWCPAKSTLDFLYLHKRYAVHSLVVRPQAAKLATEATYNSPKTRLVFTIYFMCIFICQYYCCALSVGSVGALSSLLVHVWNPTVWSIAVDCDSAVQAAKQPHCKYVILYHS